MAPYPSLCQKMKAFRLQLWVHNRKEATQQAVGKQSNAEAGRDVVITEQEQLHKVKP